MTQAQVDAINSGITKSIVDSRVIPSTSNPGYAINAEYATVAENALSANSVNNYSETLLSGLTEDDVPVSFYILTKN